VGQLVQKRYLVDFVKDECVIIDGKTKHIVTRTKMAPNKVFPLKMLIENFALKFEVIMLLFYGI